MCKELLFKYIDRVQLMVKLDLTKSTDITNLGKPSLSYQLLSKNSHNFSIAKIGGHILK